jgi:outer membrane protein assembly factor BamB
MAPSRRRVLAHLAGAAAVGTSGCLSGVTGTDRQYRLCDDSEGSPTEPTEFGGRWPAARFDAANSAVNPDAEGMTSVDRAWVVDDRTPAVFAHGGLFTLNRQLSILHPRDGATCTEVTATGTGAGMPPTVASESVYTSTHAGLTSVALDGLQSEWQTEAFSTVRSPPVVRDSSVVVTAATDSDATVALRAYDTDSGTLQWRYATDRPFWATPSVGSAAVYATTEGGLHAVSLDAGTERFVVEEPGFGTTIPVVADDRVYCRRHLGENTFELVALDAETGRVHWRRDLGANVSTPPLVHPDFLLVASERGLLRIDRRSGGEAEAIHWGGTPLAVVGDVAYVRTGSAGEELRALSLDGDSLWRYTTGQQTRGDEVDVGVRGIAPVSGGVFVSAADGLHALTEG